ncbi:MAG: diguanylate cyclase [Sedimenticola sp.]
MLNVNQEELNEILAQLDSAIRYHEEWFERVSKTLVCREQPEETDISEDAHRLCNFGNWYYNHSHRRLREHPAYLAIEPLHRTMHEYAASLLIAVGENRQIDGGSYSRFALALKRLKEQVMALSTELKDIFYNIDPLTGLLNRKGMLTRLREEQEKVKRKIQAVTLVMVDLDDFKQINDRFGHPTGDEVLRRVGNLLSDHTRVYDPIYRFGGEEFLISLQDISVPQAEEIVGRLCSEIALLTVTFDDGHEIRTSASFGITALDPNASVNECIERADKALYQAKAKGKNRFELWN